MPTANFTPFRSQHAALMAELETTYGTDPTPVSGTDDCLIYGSASITEVEVERFELRPINGSFTRQSDIVAQRMYRHRFNTLLQTSGTNGTIAINGFKGLDALLSSCRMTSTATPATNIVYAPSTIAALESCTIWAKQGAYTKKSQGVQGNVTMKFTPRSGIECAFDMLGLYNVPVAHTTEWDSYTGGTKRAQPCLNIAMTINNGASYTPVVKMIEFNCGIQFQSIDNMNATTGVERIIIVDADPKIVVTLATDQYASANITYDEWYTDLFSAGPTTHALAWSVGATTNKLAFSVPTAQVIDVKEPEDNKLMDMQITYKVQHATPQSEFTITAGA